MNDAAVADDFIPQVIRMCLYDFFCSNMKEAADSRDNRVVAERARRDAAPSNISGCYHIAVSRMDIEKAREYFKATKVPYFFRTILINAISNLTEMILIHVDGESLVFKYTMPFFGRTTKEYILDGKLRGKPNMLGRVVNVKCEQEGGTVKLTSIGPRYEPEGTGTGTFALEDVDGEEMLVWRRVVRDKDGVEKSRLDLYFDKIAVDTRK